MPTLNDPSSAPLSLQSAPPFSPNPPAGVPNAPTDPLANLRDIHLPSEISTFPIAPGWWIVAALIIIALVGGIVFWQKIRREQYYRRTAHALLQQILNSNDSTQGQLQAINALLKRVALVAYPKTNIASLHSNSWSQFLQQSAPGLAQPTEISEVLNTGIYAASTATPEQIGLLHDYASHWLKKHIKENRLLSAVEKTSSRVEHSSSKTSSTQKPPSIQKPPSTQKPEEASHASS